MRNRQEHFKRNSNLELLRILSMLMIISLHFWSNCVNLNELPVFSSAFYFGNFIRGFSYSSVNIYVLISAYFLCKSTLRLNKLFRLWACVLFYSILGLLIAIKFGFANFSFSLLIKTITPIASSEYWFITVYFGMYIVSPFLNIFINSLTARKYKILLIVLTVLYILIPSIFWNSTWIGIGKGYTLSWFVYLYLVGAYIRLYYNPKILAKGDLVKIKIGCLILAFMPLGVCIASNLATLLFFGKTTSGHDLWFNNSIIIAPLSIIIFLYFLQLSVPEKLCKSINKIALSTLAVYLIHEHPILRTHIWEFFRQFISNNIWSLVFTYFFSISTIYILCTLIDFIRIRIFKYSIDRIGFNRIDSRLKLLSEKL